jgi:proteasome lid subunit RPN8/RPN11
LLPGERVDPKVWDALTAHLERCYPLEGCGLILEGGAGQRFVPIRNALQSPVAFALDPHQHLAVEREASLAGERIVALVHSHPDGPAEPSDRDRRDAAPGGEPLYPGVPWIVVAVRRGTVEHARLFSWLDGEFHRVPETRSSAAD